MKIKYPQNNILKAIRLMVLKTKMFAAIALASTVVLSAEYSGAKDSGFNLMMTPKWTGFPYFELAAKGGKAAADELGDSFTYAGADHADPTLQLGYLAVYATHLKLAGKLDVKEGVTFDAGKAGSYTIGKDGEIVYGKPLIFTKETIDKYNF
jgi:hypothetical protein